MWRTIIFNKRNSIQLCYQYTTISNGLTKLDFNRIIEVKGWVKNRRLKKDFVFIDVNDGSCPEIMQIVIPKAMKPEELTYGSSVRIIGKLTKSPRGQIEVHAEKVEVVGKCVVMDGYPFLPKTAHPNDYLRQFLHLRSRTNYISAMLRVRNALTKHIHDFYQSQAYLNVNTPILTSNDCEGGGELFKIQPNCEETAKSMMQEGKDNDSVYFGTKAFLSVSGQLHLEAICRSMGNVYTLGPTFRAENSRSRLHLSEFYMLEAELAFCNNIEQLKQSIEYLIKHIVKETLNSNEADVYVISKIKKTVEWLDKEFITMTYDEAKTILKKKGLESEDGINKEEELVLIDYCNDVPVFITRWPKNLKSFYMKECSDDSQKVDALDLLTPVTGELFGGSVREDDYDKLKDRLVSDKLDWYLELRKFGNIPTAGYGMGLERLLQVICNITNIKDTIPFPRWPHNCSM